jgi:hypothetical protein
MTITTPRIFAQLKPSDTVNETRLLLLSPGTQGQITLYVCNQGGSVEFFRIALVPAGGVLATARFIAYDTPLTGNGVFSVAGIGLSAGDAIWVKSTLGELSFTATGIEFS